MNKKLLPEQVKQKLKLAISHVTESKDEFVLRPGKDFTRNRKLSMDTMIQLLISMGGNTLRKEMYDWFHYASDTATVSAFVQQRNKLLPAAFESIFHRFAKECTMNSYYSGYRVLAIDGSDLRLPANANDPETYIKTNETDEKGYNLAHLNAIYDLISHVYSDASLQMKRNMSEHRALAVMVDRLEINDKAIIVADRGYESFNNMAHIKEKGWYFVLRAKESYGIITKTALPGSKEFDMPVNITLTRRQTKETQKLFEQDPCKYRWLPPKATFDYIEPKSNKMYDLNFRVVRFMISSGLYETIYTNLPTANFPAEKIKHLYKMRWGIETSFRELKYTIGLASIHSKKIQFVIQEVFSKLILYNFSSLLMRFHDFKDDKVRINFSAAFLWCKRFLYNMTSEAVLLQMLLRCTSPVRTGRNFPRYQKHLSAMSLNYRII